MWCACHSFSCPFALTLLVLRISDCVPRERVAESALPLYPCPVEQAQNPEKLYRALACKLVVGMPFKVSPTLMPEEGFEVGVEEGSKEGSEERSEEGIAKKGFEEDKKGAGEGC